MVGFHDFDLDSVGDLTGQHYNHQQVGGNNRLIFTSFFGGGGEE